MPHSNINIVPTIPQSGMAFLALGATGVMFGHRAQVRTIQKAKLKSAGHEASSVMSTPLEPETVASPANSLRGGPPRVTPTAV